MTLKFYTILKFMERLLFRLHSRVKKIKILSWIMSLNTFMKKIKQCQKTIPAQFSLGSAKTS